MTQQIVEIGFPYYRASAEGGSETGVLVTCQIEISSGGSLGGVTPDDVADHIRDYLAGLSGATGSSLTKYEVASTPL